MLPAALPSLLCCCLWALPTAVLADASFVAGATAAAAGMLAAAQARTPLRRAGLAALPAFLAAAAPAPRPAPPTPAGGPLRVEGAIARIVRTPELAGCVVHFGRGRTAVRVSFDEDVAVLPGDRVAVLASVGAAALPDAPPPLRAAAATLRLVAPAPWPQRAAAACRRALERQLLALLPGEHGALVASLVLGRDTRPSDAVQQAHRATGLSHLLAVSGAHAAMLAWFLGAGGARGRRRLLASRTRTLGLVAALAAYAALVGGDAPVVRAVVAFALAALAVHLGRPCGALPLLAAPALVTAFCAPDELLGPSFLLSYAAVAGLLLAGPTPPAGFAARWLVAPVRASLWATLLTAPLTLGFFGQLAPWTILLTPLLSPLVAVLLGGGLALGLLALFAPALAEALAPGLAAAAELYLTVVTAADALPGTPLPAACAPAPALLGVAAALALAAVRTRPDRTGVAAAAALLAVPHFLPIGLRAEPGLHLAAVGHGQACVARLGDGRQVAVDCGSLQSPRLAADRLVQALARRRLDLLVITHDDADHHAGVPFLLERVHVARAVLPARLAAAPLGALLRAHGCTVAALSPGDRLAPWPDVAIAAPQLPAAAPDNDHSLWVRIAFGADSALLAGDAQELGTAAALAQGLAGPATVLVLPHHGRANANAPQLLAATAPRLALSSAAAADGATRLGGLLAARGVPLWSTGRDGSVWLAAAALATPQAAH